MKNMLVIALAFLSFNSAFAAKKTELIGSSGCSGVKVEDNFNRLQYLVNAQGQVKIDIQMENRFNSDDINFDSDSYRTSVITSLKAQGTEVIHQSTGVVCAKYKKGIIGGKAWVGSSACKIKTEEIRSPSYDQDGFANGKTCVRNYYLQVKI